MCACGCEAAVCCCEPNSWLNKPNIQIKIFPIDGQTSKTSWSTQANFVLVVGLLLNMLWPRQKVFHSVLVDGTG